MALAEKRSAEVRRFFLFLDEEASFRRVCVVCFKFGMELGGLLGLMQSFIFARQIGPGILHPVLWRTGLF
jgi:hypothetical protein